MTIATTTHFKRVLSKILKFGFLLESDLKLPSVCSTIAGEPMRGSWWSHPLAQEIFQVNEKLEDHPDILITKLVSGKVTFVHRDLWSEILAVGTSHDGWQMKGLSTQERALLRSVEEIGSLRTDQIGSMRSRVTKKNESGNVARELERKLLIHAEQIHTESGAHAKILETWQHWAKRKGFARAVIQADEAKKDLEERLQKLNTTFDGAGRLPWSVR